MNWAGKIIGGVLGLAAMGPSGAVLGAFIGHLFDAGVGVGTLLGGGADPALLRSPPAGMEVVSLAERFGRARARAETTALIEEITAAALDRFCP